MKKAAFFKTKIGIAVIVIIGLIIVFFAYDEYRAYRARKVLENLGLAVETPKNEDKKNVEKKIGEEFELATIKVKVNSSEEKASISSEYSSPVTAKENAKFIVINLDVTNITKDKFTFFTEGMNLLDNQGRTFPTYPEAIGSIDNYLDVREMSPSIKEQGVLVYELPNDSTNYALIMDKGGTNERYKVNLK